MDTNASSLSFRKLTVGERLSFSKVKPGMTKIRIGLSWDANRFAQVAGAGSNHDLDASVFVKNDQNKLVSASHLVYFNSLTRTSDNGKTIQTVDVTKPLTAEMKPCTPSGSFIHSGDNRSGDGAGDDETIYFDATKMAAEENKASIIVTIYDETKKLNFGQIENASVKLYDAETNQCFAQFDLTNDLSMATAVEVGEIYKLPDGTFGFNPISQGSKNGLEDFYKLYSA